MFKILFVCIFLFVSFSSVFAYTPTQTEIQSLASFKEKLWDVYLTEGSPKLDRMDAKIQKLLKKSKKDSRDEYILNDLHLEIQKILSTHGSHLVDPVDAGDFFNLYGKNITTNLDLEEECFEYYDFVDEIARENDFPTELIIATWRIEARCAMVNPANKHGIFQIMSQDYEPGALTQDGLKQSIEDFITFSKDKWTYFNTNTYVDYKQRFGSENIDLGYNRYTLRELRLHAVLFNGISKDTTLEGNTFANNNIDSEHVGPHDGLVTIFLKVLYWKGKRG